MQIKLIYRGLIIFFSIPCMLLEFPLLRISGARIREQHGSIREALALGKESVWCRCFAGF